MAGALCTFLLLLGAAWPTSAGDAKPLTAILLKARTHLPDSNFADSVVLVMNNVRHAPMGLIINRPTQVPLSRLFPDLKPLAQLHHHVHVRQPVEFDPLRFLFRDAEPT